MSHQLDLEPWRLGRLVSCFPRTTPPPHNSSPAQLLLTNSRRSTRGTITQGQGKRVRATRRAIDARRPAWAWLPPAPHNAILMQAPARFAGSPAAPAGTAAA
eukprot:4973248-Prymnesium_polylepis.1